MQLLHVALAALLRGALSQAPSLATLALPPRPEHRLQALPIVQNFVGAVSLRHDMVSLGAMALTPFNGNFLNCSALLVDGVSATLASSAYTPCEGTRTGAAGGVTVVNRVRMPFEQPAVTQEWKFANAGSGTHTVSTYLDGPFFRRCGPRGVGACGWGTRYPVDRASFALSLVPLSGGGGMAMLAVDSVTGVAAAAALWWAHGSSGNVSIAANKTFLFEGSFVGDAASLLHATAVADTPAAALAALGALKAAWDAEWAGACERWEQRWQAAFVPGSHFGGSLPLITSNAPDTDRLYYWAALSLVSLERTNFLGRPRTYVISQGASNSFDGSAGMGGAGQFVWDMSFAALSYSLLDPEATRNVLQEIAAATAATPSGPDGTLAVPQCWDAYETPAGSMSLGSYRFDFYSAYLFLHQFVAANNATEWLMGPLAPALGASGVELLRALALSWQGFPRSVLSPHLTDYGANKRDYLEVVSTYVSVVPALQVGSVGMGLAQARLEELLGGTGAAARAAALRLNASAILAATLTHLWRDSDGGVWRCAATNGTTTPVRAVPDYVYITQALSLLGRDAPGYLLPAAVAAASTAFFEAELLSPGTAWVRALSLSDPLCAHVNSMSGALEELMTFRADWGCLGSYGGIPGLAVESAGPGRVAAQLAQLAPTAVTAMPAQAIALGTPPWLAAHWNGHETAPKDAPTPPYAVAWPEFFDEPGWEPVWPDTERTVQNAEASIVDATIRTLFGWRPDWVTPDAPRESPEAAAAIQACLWQPNEGRGSFVGVLSGLRTPLGHINITAGPTGLSWVWA